MADDKTTKTPEQPVTDTGPGRDKPLHSGLCKYDGAVSRVRCGICIVHGEVRHLDPDGAGHAEHLHCIRPA